MFHTDYTMPPVEEEDPVIPPFTADGVSSMSIDRFLSALATGEKAIPPEYVCALAGALASALAEYTVLNASDLSGEERADLRYDAEVTTADFMWQAQRLARIACGVSENADTVESVLEETKATVSSAAELLSGISVKAKESGVAACGTAAALLNALDEFFKKSKE